VNSVSIAGSASDSVIISGQGNRVTVYLAAGVTRSVKIPEPAGPEASLGPNPYRGLAAFFEEDAERFFGRDKQVARLTRFGRPRAFVQDVWMSVVVCSNAVFVAQEVDRDQAARGQRGFIRVAITQSKQRLP
jgi:hypothetical protein